MPFPSKWEKDPSATLIFCFLKQGEYVERIFKEIVIFFFLIKNKEKYIKRRKDTREGRDTRERKETREGWEVLPTKTKNERKKKHPTLEN